MSFETNVDLYDLRASLLSGQMFRAYDKGDHFDVLSLNHYASISQNNSTVSVECEEELNSYWYNFLHLDEDLSELRALMTTNTFLAKVFEHSKGLVVLRQDPWEALVSFIISQQKRIPQIQACVEQLCDLNGKHVYGEYYAFPTADEVCSLQLAPLKLGYRMPYVYSAAYACSQGGLDLSRYTSGQAIYQEALSVLNSIQGVGPKVANCVALYGMGHGSAFPIDTHIAKILALPEMRDFDHRKYGNLAGLLQLYLFNYALDVGL